MNVLTITTDFKDAFATSQLHAVLVSLDFCGKVIENHDVTPYSIIEGAYSIWQLCKYLPKESVNLGIIDPGVGSTRAGIIIKTKNFWFVGPDNGLFYPTAKNDGIKRVWKIDEKHFGNIAKTFHGRDVFIKSAILLSKGLHPSDFGCKGIDPKTLVKLNFRNGQIVHIDAYGTLKIWGKPKLDLPFVETFSDVPRGKPLAMVGSSDLTEVAMNQASAKDYFGVKLGQVLNSEEFTDVWNEKIKKVAKRGL